MVSILLILKNKLSTHISLHRIANRNGISASRFWFEGNGNYEASVTHGRGPSEAITWLFSVSPVCLYSSRPKVSRVFGWGTTQKDDVLLGDTSFFIVLSLRLLRLGHDPSIITFDHRCS